MDILFNPVCSDEQRRGHLYRGTLLILPASPASMALVEHARDMIRQAFANDPRHAHTGLEVAQAADILAKLKPAFIHNSQTKTLLQSLLLQEGCDPQDIYQDVPRLRVAYPANYLTTGIAYAHHPHRDTWYSAPPCQLNWWMPLWDYEAEQGIAFHPEYFGRGIANSSASFNYYRWNADGRKNAAQHLKSDTRVQPRAMEPLQLESAVRPVVPAGSIIVFSGDHLHSTVRNETTVARWSIDFRTASLRDLEARSGAPIPDKACTGTSLRDFRRVHDFEPVPEAVVALYDSGQISDGVAVFSPTAEDATASTPLPSSSAPAEPAMTEDKAPAAGLQTVLT
jgi:hypothetical protein